MLGRQCFRRTLTFLLVLAPVVVLLVVVLLINPFTAGSCVRRRDCPEDHFSFYIQSGDANAAAPKICVENSLILGTDDNSANFGINTVVLSGKTGEVLMTGHFTMYSNNVTPLIELLKSIENGSVVLMASYDDPSSKLTEDARNLIAELGSVAVQSLGFRDNWVFVGQKEAAVLGLQKYTNNILMNTFDNWSELIELRGCIPKVQEIPAAAAAAAPAAPAAAAAAAAAAGGAGAAAAAGVAAASP